MIDPYNPRALRRKEAQTIVAERTALLEDTDLREISASIGQLAIKRGVPEHRVLEDVIFLVTS